VLAISELLRLDLILEVRRRPAPEYRFRHGLVQEVAYGSLLESARRSLHRRIGEALEAMYGENRAEAYGPLARHFAEADEPEHAARYLLAAGDAARAMYADREAVEYYGRAQTFLLRLGDLERQRDTRFKIALAHHLAFDFASAGLAYDSAFDCAPDEPTEAAPRTERLDLALGRPDSYAPGETYTTETGFVVEQLFRGLLRIDRDLNVVPELAQNMTVSDDGLTYLFRIRADARWSDGKPVTADDFVFGWRQLRAEEHVTAFLLDDIASAEALDDWTLQLRLSAPRNYFPYVMASHWAYPWPRHRVEELGPEWRNPGSLVGNGPYVLDSVDDDCARLSANPYWHATTGNVGEVSISFRDSATETGREEWLAGRHDVMISSRPGLAEAANTVAERVSQISTTFLAINVLMDTVTDERIRLAIAHAIDRRAVLADTTGIDHAAGNGGMIPPAMPGHGENAAPAYDPDRSKALLAEAGYPEGRGLPELVLASQPWRPGAAIAPQLEAVGIRTRVVVPDGKTGFSGEAHLWMSGWHADYPDPEGFFLGLMQLLSSLYRDDETEALLEMARASRHRDERMRLYRDFERLWIGKRAAVVPLSYERQLVVRRPCVHHLDLSPMRVSHLELVVVERDP
jgi:oligopeptide transport system substrate-binding protein